MMPNSCPEGRNFSESWKFPSWKIENGIGFKRSMDIQVHLQGSIPTPGPYTSSLLHSSNQAEASCHPFKHCGSIRLGLNIHSTSIHNHKSWVGLPTDDRKAKPILSRSSLDWGRLGKIINPCTSLMVQWIRICLPMRRTWVQSLVQIVTHAAEQLSPCTTTTEPKL